jgi:RNA polymerase sigma factor (sigma-70 family)
MTKRAASTAYIVALHRAAGIMRAEQHVSARHQQLVANSLSNSNAPLPVIMQLAIDLSKKMDGELLMLIAQRHDGWEDAFRVFYERHREYLFYICNRKYCHELGADAVQDLVQDTFVRVLEKAHTFRADDTLSPDASLRRTRGWLQRIAENLFNDHHRRNTSIPTEPLTDAHIVHTSMPAENDSQDSQDSKQMKIIKDALNSLTEREQDIMRTVYQWYDSGKNLPEHVIEELTQRYDTTPENIRQILSRARKKVREFIARNSSLSF